MRTRSLVTGFLCAGLGATACQMLIGLEREPKSEAPGDAASDQSDAAPEAAFDLCGASTASPKRPGNVLSEKVHHFVVRNAAFTVSPSARLVCDGGGAFDLDGLDTCNGGPSSGRACAPRADASCDDPSAHDLAEGRDNVLASVASALSDQDISLGDPTEQGKFGLMIKLTDYAGGPDDGDVGVEFFVLGPEGRGAPRWDGNDAWWVDSESCADPPACNTSKFRGNGYVAGGVLYATAERLLFPASVSGARVLLPVENAIIRAVPRVDGPGPQLAFGRLAGRVPLASGLPAVGRAMSSDAGKLLCEGGLKWDLFVSFVCKRADLPLGPADPQQACDALSAAITFEGWRAASGPGIEIEAGAECPNGSTLSCP